MELDGKTVLETSLENHLASSLAGVCVVIPGWIEAFGEVVERTGAYRTAVVRIESPCEMSVSLKAGWSWVRDNSESPGIMISLADQPLVGPETIDLLIDAYSASGKPFCVPTYRGRRGHPVIIGRELDGEVMKLQGDRGARGIPAGSPDLVVEVEVDSDEILIDLDSTEDFEKIQSRMRSDG